jgi:class 3 adenylate cyclase
MAGGQILISESTREAVGDAFKIDGQMVVETKGVERPIRIYDVRVENPPNSSLIV